MAQNKGPERVNAISDLEAPDVTRGGEIHLGQDYFPLLLRGFPILAQEF